MHLFEHEVFLSLLKKYKEPEWIVLPQVRVNTGSKEVYGGDRYIDFFIMNTYPSKNYKCIAIEVKQSMQDFRNDLKDRHKQVAARFYSDAFYYLVPETLWESNKNEFNKRTHATSDGLMVIKEDTKTIRIVRNIFDQEKSPFSFGFVMSLIRNAMKRREYVL